MTAKGDKVVCRSCKSGRARSGGEKRQGGRDGGSGDGGSGRDGVLGEAIREGAGTVLSGASREVGVEKAGRGRIYKGKLTELIWSGKAGRGGGAGVAAGTRGGIGGPGPNKQTPKSVGTRGCEWIGDGTLSAVMPTKMGGSTGGANERASVARRSGGKRERMGISSSSTQRSGIRSTGLREKERGTMHDQWRQQQHSRTAAESELGGRRTTRRRRGRVRERALQVPLQQERGAMAVRRDAFVNSNAGSRHGHSKVKQSKAADAESTATGFPSRPREGRGRGGEGEGATRQAKARGGGKNQGASRQERAEGIRQEHESSPRAPKGNGKGKQAGSRGRTWLMQGDRGQMQWK